MDRAEEIPIPDGPSPCRDCGRPVVEFSVPSDIWNQAALPHEYICIWCWDGRAFAAGLRYEAQFWFVGKAGMNVMPTEA
jgi:hypothetical protein